MLEFLSAPETPKRSKSMSLHPTADIDIKLIKQIGNYTLGAEVGSGAFGKVVLGKHILTGETVAIKILDKIILSQTPEDYELVRQEISILKIVKHKYIVQLYEILQTPQHIFIVMEYCEGKDLMDYILAKTRLSELESLKFFQQLINALFYLHSQNICHRDVKIDNMLLDRNRDLKLVDFGLSTKYTDDTLLDQPCGTVVYAAPEVLDGNEYHGMLADVWSSGIVLFGMTSGYLPFCDQDDEVNKKHVLEGKIELPDFFSPMLKDLLRHMLDINPITRYTLQDIREHPWFNMNDTNLIPGIIIGYNLIPVDENILNLCVAYNSDRDKIEDSVRNNKYDEGSALYYLLVRKIIRKGFESISDLSSDLFIDFILDDNNLVHPRRDKRRQKNNSVQMNRNNSKSLHKSNNTFENNYRNDLTPSTLNNKDISSSSKHIDDLGAAPRLIPPMNNNKIDKFKGKKENLLEKKKRKNKVNSVSKNNQYPGKNNDELSKKNIFPGEKNKLKNKNMVINKNNNNNNDNIKKRFNNSAQHRQNNNKNTNINKIDNNANINSKLKMKKINEKNANNNNKNNSTINKENDNTNNEVNIVNNILKGRQINDTNKNKNKENSINLEKSTLEDNIILKKDETADNIIKGNSNDKIDELYQKEQNLDEFNGNTRKISNDKKIVEPEHKKSESINNKRKINQNMNKTPIKSSKKKIYKDIKDSTFSANQEISTKSKKKYEYKNKIKNSNKQPNKNVEKMKPKNKNYHNLKNRKENNFNSSSVNNLNNSSININNSSINNINNSTINYLNKDKEEGYFGHSCLDINPSEYLKTPISKKEKINSTIDNNSKSSCKNITQKKKILEDLNKKKANMTSSDKFYVKKYNNKTIYNKNKINNRSNHYTSKSIHSTYNSKFNEMEKIEESAILYSSNKKKDYSLSRKKINITSIHGLNHNGRYFNNIKTRYKLYERNKMSFKKGNITSPINKLNKSLNNNISHSNKYNRYKFGISSSMPKIKKQTEYDPNNTIYEFNSKKKNRIRLDFNPNKQYEYTSNDIHDKKKNNKLNNSVNIGKSGEKKITRLTRYMNNYNRQSTKPRHLESSVITHRKMHSNTIRDLSYSPKQKYLNEKTRKSRIPWKIQKKGIDDKLTSETIYNKYIHKIHKYNPLKPYGNKKIRNNFRMKRNRNYLYSNKIHNRTLKSIKVDNKLLNQTSIENKESAKLLENKLNKTNIQYKTKRIKDNKYTKKVYNNNAKDKEYDNEKEKEKKLNKHKGKCFSNENLQSQTHLLKINENTSKGSYLNNNFIDSINKSREKGYMNSNISLVNNISVSPLSSKKEMSPVNNRMNIFDLSGLIIDKKSCAECCHSLVNKLKKNGYSTFFHKNNKIKSSKNGIFFEIEIIKIDNTIDENENKDIFCYKVNNKKGGIGLNKIISKILLGA